MIEDLSHASDKERDKSNLPTSYANHPGTPGIIKIKGRKATDFTKSFFPSCLEDTFSNVLAQPGTLPTQ